MPKVTVLMAVYNGEKHLREAMESILNQTFRDFEFLIVDDGSTDSSREIIASYADRRIRLMKNEINLGLTKSLNTGLRAATGEYVARMDADDVSLPERLERQVAHLDDNQGDALVGSLVEIIGEDGRLIKKPSGPAPSRKMIFVGLAFNNVMAHSSAMFRRQAVLALGGYDESFRQSQDYDLWYRMSRSQGVGMLDQALVKWRKVSGGICESRAEEQKACARRIFVKHVRETMPDISEKMLERLTRFHDRSIVCPGLADLAALRRFIGAVLDERRALSLEKPPQLHRKRDGRYLARCIVDLKKLLAICFPGMRDKLVGMKKRSCK